MKYIHLSNYLMPGLGYQENFLCKHLINIGHDATLITSDRFPYKYEPLYPKQEAGEYQEANFKVIRLTSKRIYSETMINLSNLSLTLRQSRPDVVYCNTLWSINTIKAAFLKSRFNYFLVADDHIDNANLHLDSFLKKTLYSAFQYFFLPYLKKKVDLFVSVNHESYSLLKSKYKISNPLLFPLGINTDLFYYSEEERKAFRCKYKVDDDEFVMLLSGNLDPTKGISLTMKAFNLLKDTYKVRLFIVGRCVPGYEPEFEKLMQRAPETNHIEWVSQDDLRGLYNMCDLALLPHKLGGTREAMGCGTPLMICDDRGVQHLNIGSKELCFKMNDHQDLAKKVSAIIESPSIQNELVAKTKDFVENNLSWDAVTKAFTLQIKKEMNNRGYKDTY